MGARWHSDETAGLVSSLVGSYERNCGADCPFPRFLPSKDAVIEVLETLRRVLFPGYFGEFGMEGGDIGYHVANLLIDVRRKLRQQVCRALSHAAAGGGAAARCAGECGMLSAGPSCAPKPLPETCPLPQTQPGIEAGLPSQTDPLTKAGLPPQTDPLTEADAIVGAFLAKLPALREILFSDVDATFDGDPAARSMHEIIFAYPGIFAITVFRLAHELFLLSVPLIPRIMSEHAHSLTGIDIHPGATVGHHFFIDHGTGIVIGETTVIGNHAKIYQGVTLGALSTRGGQSLRGAKRHPTLEDEVTVYSSATILGGESVIGRGAVIGANAFITHSVPAGARVSMKPPELAIKGLPPK